MKTLKESILDKDFDIDELQEISIELGPIYKYDWVRFASEAKIFSPKAPQIFDDIVKTIQNIMELHKNSKLAKVDVFYDERRKILHIIEKKTSRRAATGVRFSSNVAWGKKQVFIYFSLTFDYELVSNEDGLKKIGTIPLAVLLDIKEKMQF